MDIFSIDLTLPELVILRQSLDFVTNILFIFILNYSARKGSGLGIILVTNQ